MLYHARLSKNPSLQSINFANRFSAWTMLIRYSCDSIDRDKGLGFGYINVSQNRSDDEADENTYEDDGDIDDLDPFSDSDE